MFRWFCLYSSCVLCAQWRQFLWMAIYLFLLQFSFTFMFVIYITAYPDIIIIKGQYIKVQYIDWLVFNPTFCSISAISWRGTIGTEYNSSRHNRTERRKPLLATDQCTRTTQSENRFLMLNQLLRARFGWCINKSQYH